MNKSDVRVLGIIPARGGSKGIPRKNVAEVCGKPLIYYTIREALKARSLDATVVTTDSEEIAAVARSFGADVPFLRPAELAGDEARDLDYLRHALDWLERERGWRPEAVVYLLPTTPSRIAADIDAAVSLLMESGADSVRTMVHQPHYNPYKMWVEAEGNRVEPLFPAGRDAAPRQTFKRYYMPVAAAYVTRAECIRGGRVWGDDVRMLPFPLERFVDIDTPDDLREAEEVLRRNGLA